MASGCAGSAVGMSTCCSDGHPRAHSINGPSAEVAKTTRATDGCTVYGPSEDRWQERSPTSGYALLSCWCQRRPFDRVRGERMTTNSAKPSRPAPNNISPAPNAVEIPVDRALDGCAATMRRISGGSTRASV